MTAFTSRSLSLQRRLREIGLSDPAIRAAWPQWWSESADASPSAQAELRFSIARKLGLDPTSLLGDDDQPRFIWKDEARFKHFTGEDEHDRAIIASFGTALAGILIRASPLHSGFGLPTAEELRKTLLKGTPFVRLADLLAVAWATSIPVVHLRIFPSDAKRMAAMAVRSGSRSAILLGRDSVYPAQIAFHLAHEIGHVALGHLDSVSAIVDMESDVIEPIGTDEESEADRFALTLLTGQTNPRVLPTTTRGYSARGLAKIAVGAAAELHIEPGTLALCFGYSTGDWRTANAAMHRIYEAGKPVWGEINAVARQNLEIEELPTDSSSYLMNVLGAPDIR
jgi:hypothetical protein